MAIIWNLGPQKEEPTKQEIEAIVNEAEEELEEELEEEQEKKSFSRGFGN
ncbi:MAG: hypothetical protein ACO3QQ_06040 [Candidatus Nanopelagicaceae bacterium]